MRRGASPAGRWSPARRSPSEMNACPARCRIVGLSLPARTRWAISISRCSRAIRSLASQSWSSASACRMVGLLRWLLFEDDADAVSVGVLDVEDRAAGAGDDRLLDLGDLLTGQAGHARQGESPERDRDPQVHDPATALADLDSGVAGLSRARGAGGAGGPVAGIGRARGRVSRRALRLE